MKSISYSKFGAFPWSMIFRQMPASGMRAIVGRFSNRLTGADSDMDWRFLRCMLLKGDSALYNDNYEDYILKHLHEEAFNYNMHRRLFPSKSQTYDNIHFSNQTHISNQITSHLRKQIIENMI